MRGAIVFAASWSPHLPLHVLGPIAVHGSGVLLSGIPGHSLHLFSDAGSTPHSRMTDSRSTHVNLQVASSTDEQLRSPDFQSSPQLSQAVPQLRLAVPFSLRCNSTYFSSFIPDSLGYALAPSQSLRSVSTCASRLGTDSSGPDGTGAVQAVSEVDAEAELPEEEQVEEEGAITSFLDEDEEDDRTLKAKADSPAPRKRFDGADDTDPLEFYLWSKERLMRSEIGLPQGVKELMYRSMWDKVIVDVKRTVKVTKSVKLETYHAMVCLGNYKGLVGVGVAHSRDTRAVVGDAFVQAFHNLMHIPLYRGHTVYHQLEHQFHGIKVLVMPRPQGWGIKSNDLLHELCNMIGLRDVSVKVMGKRGQRNKMNVVKCFLAALQKQSTPHDGIEATGVYAREVYPKTKLPLRLQRQGVQVAVSATR